MEDFSSKNLVSIKTEKHQYEPKIYADDQESFRPFWLPSMEYTIFYGDISYQGGGIWKVDYFTGPDKSLNPLLPSHSILLYPSVIKEILYELQ